jgi:hypothetical protein
VRALGLHSKIHSFRWETQFIVAPEGLLRLALNGYPKTDLRTFLKNLRGRWYNRTISRAVREPGSPEKVVRSYSAGLSTDVELSHLEDSIDLLRSGVQRCITEEGRLELAREFIDHLFATTVRSADAERWAEKTPRNILFLDHLIQLYPSCRFIHIVRDGRDVVSSMMQRKFWPIAPGHDSPELNSFKGPMTFEGATRFWVAALEIASRLERRTPKENYLKIRLEDLASEPRAILETVMEFLGEDFEEQLLKQSFARAHSGRWKRDLTTEQVREFNKIAGPTMEREGYTEGL